MISTPHPLVGERWGAALTPAVRRGRRRATGGGDGSDFKRKDQLGNGEQQIYVDPAFYGGPRHHSTGARPVQGSRAGVLSIVASRTPPGPQNRCCSTMNTSRAS